MKDTEKYAKELAGIPFSELAITKDGKICRCKEILCRNCAFYERKFPFCREAKQTKTDKDTEVAELRARLDKAIELPPGDRVWYIAEDEEGQESYIISKPTNSLTVEELKYAMDKKYFSTREEAAESRAKRDKAIELPCKIGETIYTIIKNCACCQHYNVRWAECNAPATANFDCKSIHEICFTQDIIDDECKKHLFVAEMKFDLALLDPKTGKLLPCYFTDREAAEARLKELQEREGK